LRLITTNVKNENFNFFLFFQIEEWKTTNYISSILPPPHIELPAYTRYICIYFFSLALSYIRNFYDLSRRNLYKSHRIRPFYSKTLLGWIHFGITQIFKDTKMALFPIFWNNPDDARVAVSFLSKAYYRSLIILLHAPIFQSS
jgi:hypothetical protein